MRRESITDTVLAPAVVRPSDVIRVRNPLFYGSSPYLLYLIEEGAQVKKGDLLFELSSDRLEAIRLDRQFYYDFTALGLAQWMSRLEIARIQGESNRHAAQQRLDFAKFDLDQYVNGNAPLIHQQFLDAVTRSTVRLEHAQTQLAESIKLHANGYISNGDLESDRLTEEERALAVAKAQSQLNLFNRYTHHRRTLQLERAIALRESAYNLVDLRAMSQLGVAEKNVRYNNFKKILRTTRLERINRDIAETKVFAPSDGVVIYATSNGAGLGELSQPLAEGLTVYTNEQIVHIITSERKHIEATLTDMDLHGVRPGLPVRITAEALPDRVFVGHVESVDFMATQASVYSNPELRQYRARIAIDSDSADLRPGMNVVAEVIANRVENVIAVPIEALTTLTDPETGQTTYAVTRPGPLRSLTPILQPVTLGVNSVFKVEILHGLNTGDTVLINPSMRRRR